MIKAIDYRVLFYLFIFIKEARENLRIKETIIISIKQKKVIMCLGPGVKQIWKDLFSKKKVNKGRK